MRLGLITVLSMAMCGCGGPDDGALAAFPTCSRVSGLAGVAISFDGGATLVGNADPLPSGAWPDYPASVTDLVVLPSEPQTLFALSAVGGRPTNDIMPFSRGLFVSHDAGCAWRLVAVVDERAERLAASGGAADEAIAYATGWSIAYAVAADGSLRELSLPTIAFAIAGQRDAFGEFALIGMDGSIWRSHDGGMSWSRSGVYPGELQPDLFADSPFDRGGDVAAFDPSDLTHVAVLGRPLGSSPGLHASFDGGVTWEHVTAGPAYSMPRGLAFAPADGRMLWYTLEDLPLRSSPGLEFADLYTQRVARSSDGGVSYAEIAAATNEFEWRSAPAPEDGAGTRLVALGVDLDRRPVLLRFEATGEWQRSRFGGDREAAQARWDCIRASPVAKGALYLVGSSDPPYPYSVMYPPPRCR